MNAIALFPKRDIDSTIFAANVFSFVLKFVKDPSRAAALREEVKLISSMRPESERERAAILLYQRLEHYLLEDMWRRQYGTEYLRKKIRDAFHPERCQGDFAFIFRAQRDQKIGLMAFFLSALLSKLALFPLFAETLEGTFLKTNDVPRGEVALDVLERGLKSIPLPEQESTLKQFLRKVIDALQRQHGAIHAETFLREAYVRCKNTVPFAPHVPWLLTLLPDSILQEERVVLLERDSLEEVVRRRTRELEEANAYLAGERGRLEKTLRDLEDAKKNLEALDKAKGEFIGVVSHQFRTPLSVIRWHTELMEDVLGSQLPQEARDSLSAIYDKCLFLIDILNNIYDVLAVEGKMVRLELRPIPLWEIVDESLKAKSRIIERHKVPVKFRKSEAMMLSALPLDPHKIRRVVDILITNAVQFTPPGGEVDITIDRAVHEGKPVLRCTVEDTGIGIAPEDLPKIFTKFFRARDAIRAVPDGAGLGLYLVKQFVQMHHGEVMVKSTPGKGSRFSFVLPLPKSPEDG